LPRKFKEILRKLSLLYFPEGEKDIKNLIKKEKVVDFLQKPINFSILTDFTRQAAGRNAN